MGKMTGQEKEKVHLQVLSATAYVEKVVLNSLVSPGDATQKF